MSLRPVIAILAALALLAGCGDDSDSDSGGGSERGGLGGATYDKLLTAFEGAARIGREEGQARSLDDVKQLTSKLVPICNGITGSDPILVTQRRVCIAGARIIPELVEYQSCSSPRSCPAVRTLPDSLGETVEANVANNKAVAGADLTEKCAAALAIKDSELASLREVLGGFEQIERGIESNSPSDVSAGQAAVAKGQAGTGAIKTDATFRAGCG